MNVALRREKALAGASAGAGAVEDGVVLFLQMRRSFDRHGAADVNIGGVDFRAGKTEMGEQIEGLILQFFERNF